MKENPLVSIIIPTYNRAQLIGETLDSVVSQCYQNWECIVVDDGSEDRTEAVIMGYVNQDNRFKFFKRPDAHKPGGNGARNYGFLKSTGDFINWFDSDDVMAPDFIATKMQCFIKEADTDVVFSAFENVNKMGKRTRIANKSFSGDILNDLVNGDVSFGPYSYMLRRNQIANIRFDESLKKNQDLDFFFRFFTASNSLKIVHVNKILFTVKTHDGSMSYRSDMDILKMASIYQVYLMVLNYFAAQKHTKGINRYKKHCLNSLKVMLRNGHYQEVVKRLLAFPYLSIGQKLYLMGCTVSQFLIKRGANQFVVIDS
ncbi:glycosyltransferase involved in cell wall biosynthesis [Winogradskyella epiphytica]|uniref:Glycosyltransferase involved in cell wall biosynthesis n=1 Tax=Winogradskyella epiphytica TaxID=262005 RepID=A0A2V4XH30_9FLAO|nr:glycosyltransferase family 2 protein [Winogradskyella epiphytica]PYE82144.1 glycosyltransferase involved in cell wall biosynthesis [Winogradskyella epiphytica]GGW60256.1 hypothetical protein GCM10008085_09520 [Winogradskyella epiphytica]